MVAFCIYFNYFKAVTTKAGSPRDYVPESFLGEHYCRKCSYPKPERSHHCSICNTCVMRMDHHCPWLSNCVGLRNYRYFLCFLFWVTLGTAYLSALCGPKVFVEGSPLSPRNAALYVRRTFLFQHDPEETEMVIGVGAQGHANGAHGAHQGHSVYKHIYEEYRRNKHLRGHKHDHVPEPDQEQRRLLVVGIEASGCSNLTLTEADRLNLFQPFKYTNRTISSAELQAFKAHYNTSFSGHRELEIAPRRLHTPWEELLLDEFLVFFSIFLISIGVALATGALLSMHLYLVCTNQTTIELFQARQEDPRAAAHQNIYDKGTAENFAEVMGTKNWFLAFLPTFGEIPTCIEECRTGDANRLCLDCC